MKTDVRKFEKVSGRYGAVLILGLFFVGYGLFIYLDVTAILIGLVLLVIFGIPCYTMKQEYDRHVQLMQEHGYKSPEMILDWLLSASHEDKVAFIDFLEKDSLGKLSSIMEDKMYISPQKEL